MFDLETAITAHKDIFPAIGWIVIIFGWIYASKDAIRRERRREVLDFLVRMRSVVDELEALAHAYYALSGGDSKCRPIARKMKYGVSSFSKRIGWLVRTGCLVPEAQTVLVDFRKSITGNDFEDSQRSPYPDTSSKFDEISEAASSLRMTLDGYSLGSGAPS